MNKTKKSTFLKEKKGIICGVLKERDLKQAVSCLSMAFSEGEPMTKALGITFDEFSSFAQATCSNAANEGLSMTVKDLETNEVMAVSIAADLMTDPLKGKEKIHEKILPLLALVDELDDRYKALQVINRGEVFRLFLLGNCSKHQRSGLSTLLIEKHLQLAKKKDFTAAIAEVTGPISRHILVDKFGFKERFMVDYQSFHYHKVRVFEKAKDSQGCILVEKHLKDNE